MSSSSHSDNVGNAGSFLSLKTILVIGALVFVFSKDIISDIRQVMKYRTVTATIIDRDQSCRLVLRLPNNKRTHTKMACAEALALKKADDSRKTRVYKTTYVTLSYTLINGKQHTARVRERKVRARRKPIGGQIQVAYSKRNPNTLTRPKTWGKVFNGASLFMIGLIALIAYLFGYQKLQSLFGRIKKSIEDAAQEAQTRSGRAEILARIEENFSAKTANAVLGPSEADALRARPPRPARRRKKPAPIPKTGGVVSKRRRGLFG